MPLIRVQVFMKLPTDLPRDGVSNTLYFDHDGLITPDYEQINEDIRDIYANFGWWNTWAYDIRAYDNGDPKGTPPKSRITGTFAGTAVGLGPREVAVCLSYRTDPPYTSRRRGRIYLGPVPVGLMNQPRVPAPTLTKVRDMGVAFSEIGGENVSWRIYSPTNNENHHIRYCWVDNAWDTIRGRGLASDTRVGTDV